MREDPRGTQSDRKGVDRSRGQGETVSHRPESLSEALRLVIHSLALLLLLLQDASPCSCRGGMEAGDGGARTFTAEAQLATASQASVPRGTAHAMDAGLPVHLHTVHAIQPVSETEQHGRARIARAY